MRCLITLALLVSGLSSQPLLASGGDTTVHSSNRQAFSLPARNMPLSKRLDFQVGNSFFRNPWVTAPSSTTARDGLGPLFNTNGCQNCHIRDGRGHPPEPDDINSVSMLVRLSIPATRASHHQQLRTLGVVPEPVYGEQLQDFAVAGVKPEGQIAVRYESRSMTLADGSTLELRKPTFSIDKLNYGPLHRDVMLSPRIAPAMIGLGLLQAIEEKTLQQLADPEDSNGDGISGRINRVWDLESKKQAAGRFGWKAGQPTLKQQNSAAFNADMGITSLQRDVENCSPAQEQCRLAPGGGRPEIADDLLDQVTFYTHNLGVPARRNPTDPQVQRGEKIFSESNCNACHVEQITTGDSQFSWLSGQTIAPYSDLLLHDMGSGLADNRPEFLASGSEWRTPPLWGIGLTETVAGKANFLHDGRARNLLEAIAWHGGEAQASRDRVLSLSTSDREALLVFLHSL